MYKNSKITLYLPCRNESLNLEKIAARIPEYVDEKIIISNKSTDSTVKKAKKLGFKVYEDNRSIGGIGYGFAHMTGIKKATGDIIIAADGDAEHPIEDLNKIIRVMIKNKYDFMYCSRYPLTDSSDTSFKQRLGVFLLNIEVRVLYGIKLNDVLSGMWLMRKEIKDQLALSEGDWNLSPQIKINAARNPNIKFGEYYVAQHKRVAGKTHQQYFKTGIKHMMWILSNRVNPRKELILHTNFKLDSEAKSKLFFNLG